MASQPPRVLFNFEPELQAADSVDEEFDGPGEESETGEENPNFIYDEDVPQFVEKEAINEDVIFELDNSLSESDNIKTTTTVVEEMPVATTVKPKKPRKPMSEAHKAKLAVAREKALETRRANALVRKKMKDVDIETKSLKNQKKVKELEVLKQDINGLSAEVAEVSEVEVKQVKQVNTTGLSPPSGGRTAHSGITKADLEQAQFDAIQKYETLRKSRKAEKKKQQQLEQDQQQLINQIKPHGYKYRDGSNKWDMCY
tara:strand:+ start:1097 stop:1867 length:771 start_codon:yes stop_codon:yes gene_type:complete